MSVPQVTSSDTRIVDQIQENMLAYFRLFAGLPGITAGSEDVFWFVNAKGEPDNHVLRTRLDGTDIERRIDDVIDQIGQYTDNIDWLVFPGCRPNDLGRRLEARGMPGGPGGTWMLADLASLSTPFILPEHFRIADVRDTEMLETWQHVSAAGFGIDTQIYYDAYARHGFGDAAIALHAIGYLHDEPVTSATLLLAGGIAGIWDVSTPPAFRGHGYGSAITLALLQTAYERGYQQAWVWSSEMGKTVYSKLGFVATDFGIREYRWRKRQGLEQ